ncbi:MAG: class I SAM-dependent methyltransferase, partial [Ferruginibacter sp.]
SFEENIFLNILDVGCGDGATEFFMQQYFSQWLIQGIDVSAESIRLATHKKLHRADFSVYDGSQIPFEAEKFDIVFIAGVLHHIDYSLHSNLIKEIYRVLKTGGRLYLFEHNPLNPVTKYLVNTCVFDNEARLLKNDYTSALLRREYFKINTKKFIIFFPRKGILSKLVFLEKYLQWLPLGGQYFIRSLK